VIGGDKVIDGYYLNQGSLQLCDTDASALNPLYCEFERFFEDDVSRALSISSYRVQVLFVKQAAYDAVLVHFRIMPQQRHSNEVNSAVAIANLVLQVNDMNSVLYKGNVTIRVDSLWVMSASASASARIIVDSNLTFFVVIIYREFLVSTVFRESKKHFSHGNGTNMTLAGC
jgi:hypothetical protein